MEWGWGKQRTRDWVKEKELRWERERKEKEIGEKSGIWFRTWSTRSLWPRPSYWICMSREAEEPKAIVDSHSSCGEVYSRPSHGELSLCVSAVWQAHEGLHLESQKFCICILKRPARSPAGCRRGKSGSLIPLSSDKGVIRTRCNDF